MIEFNIGDRVVTESSREGTVLDVLYSNLNNEYQYIVQFDDADKPFYRPLRTEKLSTVKDNKTYRYEIFRADNVMVAVLYESDGENEREIRRGHGHIMHDGLIGIAQAASYAAKKIYIGMNNGQYIGTEDNQYVRSV